MKVLEIIREPLAKACYMKGGMIRSQTDARNAKFNNFPYAKYAVDTRFQPTNRPSGHFEEAKKFFSVKHANYGVKASISTLHK